MSKHSSTVELRNVPKAQRLSDTFNGVIRTTEYWDNDGRTLLTQTSQPGRDAILNQNAELRKDPGALRKLDTLRLELSIPEIDMPVLKRLYPGLAATDHGIRTQAWNHFINSAAGDLYRVRPRTSKARMI